MIQVLALDFHGLSIYIQVIRHHISYTLSDKLNCHDRNYPSQELFNGIMENP